MTVLTEKNPRVSRPMKFKRVGLTGQLYRHCPLMTFRSAMGPAHRTGAPQLSRSQVPCLKKRHLCSGGLSSDRSRTRGRGSPSSQWGPASAQSSLSPGPRSESCPPGSEKSTASSVPSTWDPGHRSTGATPTPGKGPRRGGERSPCPCEASPPRAAGTRSGRSDVRQKGLSPLARSTPENASVPGQRPRTPRCQLECAVVVAAVLLMFTFG